MTPPPLPVPSPPSDPPPCCAGDRPPATRDDLDDPRDLLSWMSWSAAIAMNA